LQSRLEKNGYSVIVAYDGQEALGKTYQENPDLIILDIMLPETDGYNVCKMLRSDIEKYFIVITSDNNMIACRKPKNKI
jgi:two-component system response regulator VicR